MKASTILTAIFATAMSACSPGGNSPAEEASATPEIADEAPTDETAVIGSADPQVVAWIEENYADFGNILYAMGEADLDGDGQAEVLAYVGGPMLCGTGGCNLIVFQRTAQGLELLADIGVAQLPVGVLETSTNGWRDLAVSVRGGGIEGGVARVPFGEDQYASNPTVAPAEITQDSFETVIPDAPLVSMP